MRVGLNPIREGKIGPETDVHAQKGNLDPETEQ